jgi:hypothetical protein
VFDRFYRLDRSRTTAAAGSASPWSRPIATLHGCRSGSRTTSRPRRHSWEEIDESPCLCRLLHHAGARRPRQRHQRLSRRSPGTARSRHVQHLGGLENPSFLARSNAAGSRSTRCMGVAARRRPSSSIRKAARSRC